jgi:SNF2 family DNA or RNA helicase
VFDEAHYCSNPDALRTKACLGLDDAGVRAPQHPLSQARFVWPLSGTPGNPSQMWTWLRTFGVTELSWSDWTERYCRTRWTNYGLQVMGVRSSKLAELKAIMSPYVLRRTTKDVGLPQARWGVLSLACSVDNVDRSSLPVVDPNGDELPDPEPPIATLIRELGERKVAPIIEIVSAELESGELDKIVIFAWHRNVIERLTKGLLRYGAHRIEGGMPELVKQANIDRFQTDPAYRVLVCQHEAGGVGLDLSAAADVLLAELSWNPDDNTQAAARVLGPKQSRPVMVRVAASADPLDYALARVTARKNTTLQKTWS